jgi:hypothetical protein
VKIMWDEKATDPVLYAAVWQATADASTRLRSLAASPLSRSTAEQPFNDDAYRDAFKLSAISVATGSS